jgi:hypothetical protein
MLTIKSKPPSRNQKKEKNTTYEDVTHKIVWFTYVINNLYKNVKIARYKP